MRNEKKFTEHFSPSKLKAFSSLVPNSFTFLAAGIRPVLIQSGKFFGRSPYIDRPNGLIRYLSFVLCNTQGPPGNSIFANDAPRGGWGRIFCRRTSARMVYLFFGELLYLAVLFFGDSLSAVIVSLTIGLLAACGIDGEQRVNSTLYFAGALQGHLYRRLFRSNLNKPLFFIKFLETSFLPYNHYIIRVRIFLLQKAG